MTTSKHFWHMTSVKQWQFFAVSAWFHNLHTTTRSSSRPLMRCDSCKQAQHTWRSFPLPGFCMTSTGSSCALQILWKNSSTKFTGMVLPEVTLNAKQWPTKDEGKMVRNQRKCEKGWESCNSKNRTFLWQWFLDNDGNEVRIIWNLARSNTGLDAWKLAGNGWIRILKQG